MDELLLPQWREPTPEMRARQRGFKRRQLVGILGGVIGASGDLARLLLRSHPALAAQCGPVLLVAFALSGALVAVSAAWEIVVRVRQWRMAASRREWIA